MNTEHNQGDCTNHFSDGSKIFPNRDCCRIEPAATEPTTEQIIASKDAEIARLKVELATAKADSAMLDWLESDQCYWVEIQSNPSGKRIYYGQPSDKDLYINLRAAIADAMKGAQQ